MAEEDEKQDGSSEDEQRNFARMLASVKDAAVSNISLLSTQAWHHLGLMPIPGLDDGTIDLEQAKLAIDLYEANIKVLEGKLDQEMIRELRRNLMNLQMNFVNKSKE